VLLTSLPSISVVDLVAEYEVAAVARADAPGVYVAGDKLASVGLRIRRGSSFHGMALNVDVDLEPFSRINPCGYADEESSKKLLPHLLAHLGL